MSDRAILDHDQLSLSELFTVTVRNPMGTKLKTIALATLKGIWQASRYALATGITALTLAVLPVLVVVILTVAGGICIAALSLMMLGSAVSGTADPPFIALFFAVALPIGFVIVVAVTFAAVIASALLFTGLLVLPISLLTEIALQLVSVRSIPTRVASFPFAGGLTGGLVTSTIWVLFKLQADIWTVVAGSILFLACVLSVGLFGFVLTMAETTRKVLSGIASRLYARLCPKLYTDCSGEQKIRYFPNSM